MVQLTGKEKNNNSIFLSLMDSNANKGLSSPNNVFKPQVSSIANSIGRYNNKKCKCFLYGHIMEFGIIVKISNEIEEIQFGISFCSYLMPCSVAVQFLILCGHCIQIRICIGYGDLGKPRRCLRLAFQKMCLFEMGI